MRFTIPIINAAL